MEAQKVVINDDRTRFYCWGWDKYFPLWKLGRRCFSSGCRFMYVPRLPHLRRATRIADEGEHRLKTCATALMAGRGI